MTYLFLVVAILSLTVALLAYDCCRANRKTQELRRMIDSLQVVVVEDEPKEKRT